MSDEHEPDLLVVFEDGDDCAKLTVEQLSELCSAPASWARYLAMRCGGPAARMTLHNPATGKPEAKVKVISLSRTKGYADYASL